MRKNRYFSILIFIILIGAFLRFYKLDWGNGLFTHPDEYHIVASVNQLSFPDQMNPHFFSYGTVTIYLIYFTKIFFSKINIFLIGRFYSALFSTLTILVVYKISSFFLDKPFSLLAAFLVSITPGLIQQAHFTTPESNLIFFIFTSLLFLLYFLEHKKTKYIFFSSIFLGFALGVKISSLVFLLPLIVSKIKFRLNLTILITTIITLAIVAPFIFLDFPAFRSNLEYEGSLAAGKIPIFYTRQFINTIPILFQIEKIYPYTLGLPLLIAGIGGFFLMLINVMLNLFQHLKRYKIPKQVRNDRNGILFLILISFLSIFIPNAFLFAKWTRFISPTFPFFAIFSAFLLWEINIKYKRLSRLLIYIIIIGTSIWTYAFFSIYKKPDVRISASNWLTSHIQENSTILVEGANMIDVPINGNYKKISLDFYNLEQDTNAQNQIVNAISTSDYFIIQSRRVFMNHQRLPKLFPKTKKFYDKLFDGNLGFTKIKEFHQYPTFLFLEFPDEQAEETWSVFDHPVIRVFKKTNNLPKDTYAKIFKD